MRRLILTLITTLLLTTSFSHAATPQQGLPPRAESIPPADLVQMFKDYDAAMVSKDMDRIMAFYSSRYRHDGRTKASQPEFIRSWIDMISKFEMRPTRFAAIDDDHAYIEAKGESDVFALSKAFDYQVIKENGQWKWLGNQKPAPPERE